MTSALSILAKKLLNKAAREYEITIARSNIRISSYHRDKVRKEYMIVSLSGIPQRCQLGFQRDTGFLGLSSETIVYLIHAHRHRLN